MNRLRDPAMRCGAWDTVGQHVCHLHQLHHGPHECECGERWTWEAREPSIKNLPELD